MESCNRTENPASGWTVSALSHLNWNFLVACYYHRLILEYLVDIFNWTYTRGISWFSLLLFIRSLKNYRYEKFTIVFFQIVETYRDSKLWMFVNLWVDGRIYIMRKIFRNEWKYPKYSLQNLIDEQNLCLCSVSVALFVKIEIYARLSNDKSILNSSVISVNHSRSIIGNIVEIRDLETDNSSSEALSTS